MEDRDESMADEERVTCDVCGKSFDSRKQMKQHKHDVHDTNDVAKEIKSHSNGPFKIIPKKLIIIIISVGILIAIAAGVYSGMGPNTSSASKLTIDGIQCNTMEQATFHIHTHLDIFINGNPYTISSQIGIKPDDRCLYWLHTHDDSGIIHIEAPEKRDFTLGQFFDIWNKKFNNSQIFDNVANGKNNNNNNATLSVYVNGQKVSNGANYRDIKLNAHDEIAIVFGKQPAVGIPSKYSFPKEL